MISLEKIKEIKKEHSLLKNQVSDISNMKNQSLYKSISKKFNNLDKIVFRVERIENFTKQLAESKELLKTEKDNEMAELFLEEIEKLENDIQKETEILKEILLPKDTNDEKDVIVEIRAGTGGEEAALFVSDLYRMYSYYAERKKWKKEVISFSSTGIGGYKEVIFSFSGKDVYSYMRFESGVHRVQRIPETETQGRIHTSAVTVAVLPEADEVEIEIADKDLKIDVYRSSGHGGQSVNTTDSAVRITHLPSGFVVTCQDEKSQLKNKQKAMKVLRSRLLDAELAKAEAERSINRKTQVGTGDRSAKIRTYNYPQSRITDHRISLTSYKMNNILQGELDEFVEALRLAYRKESIEK